MTANQAYKQYEKSWEVSNVDGATDEPKLSFKQWWEQQKKLGNVDEAGKLLLDRFFPKPDQNYQGSFANDPSINTSGSVTNPSGDIPKPTTSKTPWGAIAITVGVIIVLGIVLSKVSKAKTA